MPPDQGDRQSVALPRAGARGYLLEILFFWQSYKEIYLKIIHLQDKN